MYSLKRMKRIAVLILGLVLLFAGCTNDESVDAIDVTGTWRAPVTFQMCTPADVCSDAGFDQGSTLNAIMTLTQNNPNRTQVEGTYTYDGAGITADLEGTIGGTQLSVDGAASNPLLGSITVRFTGTVSGNSMNATVTHQINLSDGRSGDVSGTGTFVR